MPVLIIKNIVTEGPGTIEDFLRQADVSFRIVELGLGELPPALEKYDSLVVLGGPMGVYEMDKYPHLLAGSRIIREAINRDMRVLGICLGAQMIAHCLGAHVYPGPEKEIGWHLIELTGDGLQDPLMRRLATHPGVGDFWRRFLVFHWHGDTFDLPPETVLLAGSTRYPHQAFRHRDKVYGFQFHMEVTKDAISEWFKDTPHLKRMVDKTVSAYDEYFGRAMNFYKMFFRKS